MRNDINGSRLEKAMRIFEALSGVDEELLKRSEEENAVKISHLWKYNKVMASCLCLIAVGALAWGAFQVTTQHKTANQAMPESISGYAEDIAIDVTDGNCAAAVNGEGQLPVTGGNAAEGALIEEEQEAAEKENGASGVEGLHMADAEQAIQDSTDHFSSETMKENENKQTSAESDDVCSIMLDSRKEVKEEEARATEGLGEYIPTSVPEGYVFEIARREQNPDTEESVSITVTWQKGMDSIFWLVRTVDSTDVELTDLSKTESYNVHLYDIPYAETVPEEYREVFDDPVFRAEDLSLEVIEMRMKSVQDAGDTDTPRGVFSVLYKEGILVRFNGDGSAQEIWEMFQSVKP